MNDMRTKQEVLNAIENYVRNYVVPLKPKGFIPVIYTVPFSGHTDQDINDLKEIELLVEKTNPSCVGRITICTSFVKPNQNLLGVALLPKKFKHQKILIVDVPFKPIFERAG